MEAACAQWHPLGFWTCHLPNMVTGYTHLEKQHQLATGLLSKLNTWPMKALWHSSLMLTFGGRSTWTQLLTKWEGPNNPHLEMVYLRMWPGFNLSTLHGKVADIPLGITLTPTLPTEAKLLVPWGSQFTEIPLNAWPWFTVVWLGWNPALSLADAAIQPHCQWCRAKNGCCRSSWWAEHKATS